MLTATIKICECTEYHTHPDDPSYEICKCGGHFRAKTYTLNQVKKLGTNPLEILKWFSANML